MLDESGNSVHLHSLYGFKENVSKVQFLHIFVKECQFGVETSCVSSCPTGQAVLDEPWLHAVVSFYFFQSLVSPGAQPYITV